jgi:hypothetical protein
LNNFSQPNGLLLKGTSKGALFLPEVWEMTDFRNLIISKAFKAILRIDYHRVSNELRKKEEGSFILYEVMIKENEKGTVTSK